MKLFLKYGVIPVGSFVFLLLATVIFLPVLVNLEKLAPLIERKVAETTGRSCSLGPDLSITFFPWLSISFSKMKLGNPPGFLSENFVQIDSFEARIKLLPLLKREVQVSRFVVGGLSINLERNSSGQENWQFTPPSSATDGRQESLVFLPENLSFALFAVTDGKVKWMDRQNNRQHSVEDLMLLLNDVAPNRPISLDCKATIDGKPITFEGKIGTLRAGKANEPLAIDIDINLANKIRGKAQGTVGQLASAFGYDLNFNLEPFSPREVLEIFNLPQPFTASHAETYRAAEMNVQVRGDVSQLRFEKGTARLDDSKMVFSANIENIVQPDITFAIDLDRLDLDRYVQLNASNKAVDGGGDQQTKDSPVAPSGWQDVAFAGDLKIGELKIHGGKMTDLTSHVSRKAGVVKADPLSFNLYNGRAQSTLVTELLTDVPRTDVTLKFEGINVEPMLQDFAALELLRGNLDAEGTLQCTGMAWWAFGKRCNGHGVVTVQDGALLGVDLLPEAIDPQDVGKIVQFESNVQKPTTKFTELRSQFAINEGVLVSRATNLKSATQWIAIDGTADLAGGQINMKLESKSVKATPMSEGQVDLVAPSVSSTLTGTWSDLELKMVSPISAKTSTAPGKKANAKNLVDQKLPSPVDDDVKNLVGKSLVDPAVVAQRFRLQPETIKQGEVKKIFPVGSGKVVIGKLREEATL